jgi:hypothetical protein
MVMMKVAIASEVVSDPAPYWQERRVSPHTMRSLESTYHDTSQESDFLIRQSGFLLHVNHIFDKAVSILTRSDITLDVLHMSVEESFLGIEDSFGTFLPWCEDGRQEIEPRKRVD